MGTLVKKLKVDVRRGIVTPPTTISKRARDSSDEDHTTAEPPTKKRWIASSKSAASKRASIDNLDCDNVPDVPEADLLALEQVWRQAKRMKSAQPQLTSITRVTKSLDTYTTRIFRHRSIRYLQTSNGRQLCRSDVAQNKLPYHGDLVLADEEEDNTASLDGIIRSLNYRLPNERTWEAELYTLHIFLQTGHLQIPSGDDPPVAVRLLQHPMKVVVQLPGMPAPYTCYPPIVSDVDRRLTDGIGTATPWLGSIQEGKVINDIVYAVHDPCLWTSIIGGHVREQVRAKLAGYNLFPDSNHMLPYLLIEDKRQGEGPGYATAYIILIAASILHQRLKLRALGNMQTTVSCPELVVHCMVMVGSDAHYIRVGLRGPSKAHAAGTDELVFVRYHCELRGVFDLSLYQSRNQFKSLLRMIHTFGIGSHHEIQKLEVKNAIKALNSATYDSGAEANMDSIMSVDTAFHCVPIEGEEGEYALQHTDDTRNGRIGDDLEPKLSLMDDPDSSNANTRNLLLPTDDPESSIAGTTKNPAKPATKNKGKAPAKEKKKLAKGMPTSSRVRKIDAIVDEEEEEEKTKEVTQKVAQKKVRASKRLKTQAAHKEQGE